MPLRDTELLLREIAEAGLSSREGCGNTVRNVTGDPWAGVAADEVFDPTPYAGAYVRYFVRHPTTQLMPRKIKTSFTGSDEDRAISGIHDIAFLSRERDGVKGFEVRVGGGTSIMARVAPTLYEFVEADNGDYLKVAEAVLRIFDRQEWLRVNRARARIKVLVDKIGIDAFREHGRRGARGRLGRGARVRRRAGRAPPLRRRRGGQRAREPPPPPPPRTATAPSSSASSQATSRRSARRASPPSRSRSTRGDLTPEQFRGLAADHARVHRRLRAQHRAAELRPALGPRRVPLRRLAAARASSASARPAPREITDVVSCPGTDSCKLGITSSMGLNRAIKERVESMEITDELTKRIHIKMSGCPNGCSQHHIANIGFYGASLKVGGRQMPAYIPHIGGNYEGGEVVFGTRLKSRLPAKRVPEAVERWIRLYEAERNDGEEFNAFAERVGAERFEEAVKDLTLPAEFSLETMQQFIDWNRSEPLQGRARRGGVRDLSAAPR